MERNNEEEEDQKELGAPQLLEPFRFENYLGSDGKQYGPFFLLCKPKKKKLTRHVKTDAEGTEYNLVVR